MFFSVAFSPSLNTVSGPFGQMSFSFVVTLLELSRGFAAARRSVFFVSVSASCYCTFALRCWFAVRRLESRVQDVFVHDLFEAEGR